MVGMKKVVNALVLIQKPFLLVTVVALMIFIFFPNQMIWEAVITCTKGAAVCNGTESADIFIATTDDTVIHGLGGNDYIKGYIMGNNIMYGDEGDDTLIGGLLSDYMSGGTGNDKYDGSDGDDTLADPSTSVLSSPIALPMSGDDVMSGGPGGDYIVGGTGADRIHGGPGSDLIYPNNLSDRDFSHDFVDCGSDYDFTFLNSADDTVSINCEEITDYDG
jgi:Ca2+-binding RTX toxin-like protein